MLKKKKSYSTVFLNTELNHVAHFISELFPGKQAIGLLNQRHPISILLNDLGCPER